MLILLVLKICKRQKKMFIQLQEFSKSFWMMICYLLLLIKKIFFCREKKKLEKFVFSFFCC